MIAQQIARKRWPRIVGLLLVATSMTACPGDDDNDGEAEIEVPEVSIEDDNDAGEGS